MQNVIIRGGGDLASGTAIKLKKCGYNVVITELEKPLSVRRKVSFSEAIYDGEIEIEGYLGRKAKDEADALLAMEGLEIPILVDPELEILRATNFSALVDSRIMKARQDYRLTEELLVVGLGPGFTCGQNCHAAVETQRGHHLGRLYWQGSTSEDTGTPEGDPRRVFRAPVNGMVKTVLDIGTAVNKGDLIAFISDIPIYAPISGVIRGMIRDGSYLTAGVKMGDVDARNEPRYCTSVSDKAFAVAGAVLEALIVYQNRKNVR